MRIDSCTESTQCCHGNLDYNTQRSNKERSLWNWKIGFDIRVRHIRSRRVSHTFFFTIKEYLVEIKICCGAWDVFFLVH